MLTEREYRDKIETLAQIAIGESESIDEPIRVVDAVTNVIHGDELITKRKHRYRVLEYSEYDSYAREQFGSIPNSESWDSVISQAVYYAVAQDVQDKVHELRDE